MKIQLEHLGAIVMPKSINVNENTPLKIESAKKIEGIEKIYVSTEDDKIPFENDSFDLVFISLCLHHIDSATCKLLLKEFFLKHQLRLLHFTD